MIYNKSLYDDTIVNIAIELLSKHRHNKYDKQELYVDDDTKCLITKIYIDFCNGNYKITNNIILSFFKIIVPFAYSHDNVDRIKCSIDDTEVAKNIPREIKLDQNSIESVQCDIISLFYIISYNINETSDRIRLVIENTISAEKDDDYDLLYLYNELKLQINGAKCLLGIFLFILGYEISHIPSYIFYNVSNYNFDTFLYWINITLKVPYPILDTKTCLRELFILDNVTPSYWGPNLWSVLHSISEGFVVIKNKADVNKFDKYFEDFKNLLNNNLSTLLPCQMCSHGWKNLVIEKSVDIKNTSVDDFPLLMFSLHSRVQDQIFQREFNWNIYERSIQPVYRNRISRWRHFLHKL
jgi:hypothetical protein